VPGLDTTDVVETGIAVGGGAMCRPRRERTAVEERIGDQTVLRLLRAMMRAVVVEGGQARREVTRAAQGDQASLRA
jgi:RNA-directed DNA polymerase